MPIALVISDVDGTLVTDDKRLTEANVRAVQSLHARGIGFTVISSRPPFGFRMLAEPLALRLPLGAFNGGAVVEPNLRLIEQHPVPEPAARRSLEVLAQFEIDAWLFTPTAWLARDPNGDYVDHERRTIQTEPTLVPSFDPYLSRASKIVGVSKEFARLDACEPAMRDALGAQASVARSQAYYLDVTPPGVNKGTFVEWVARRLNIPTAAIAVLGDMENDVAMFEKAGLSIAMGNASPAVKGRAHRLTASNAEDGFAQAIERYILGA
jgi:Cof subfamily protein (haloacid dehalogenase superfamily)